MKGILKFIIVFYLVFSFFARADTSLVKEITYEDVKKTIDRRCVVCHSCYNSPCQLKLSSYEGILRGGTKEKVYHGERIEALKPTRLFIDAKTSTDWHKDFSFHSVISKDKKSTMETLVSLHYKNGAFGDYESESNSLACVANDEELDLYVKQNPMKGMPYGLPKLSSNEYSNLLAWLQSGSKKGGTIRTDPNEKIIVEWEDLLNQKDNKSKLSSRYLYEHLFLAHIFFDEEQKDFYRLVRSKTKSPLPVDEIATVRPYDDPKVEKFYYRLRKIESTIVHKTHILYPFNSEKMNRLKELFYDKNWGETQISLPSYEYERSANPFETFAQIPAKSRYQFLLDNAHYHVMTFIRGPVCKGQVALNVINDHFWVMFLDPKSDISVNNPRFLRKTKSNLAMPASGRSDLLKSYYPLYKKKQSEYVKTRFKYYQNKKFGISDIWNGDGSNPSAFLTVYRHYDSATVLQGKHGGIPKTLWVIDYPVLERIYYNLVAGFNVFGNFAHQVSTRRYMDNLRVESEDLFLSFLPKNIRQKYRDYWYRGSVAKSFMKSQNPFYAREIDSKVSFNTRDYKIEFLDKVFNQRFKGINFLKQDQINDRKNIIKKKSTMSNLNDLEYRLSELTHKSSPFVTALPKKRFDISFIRFRRKKKKDLVYTIFLNKAHSNVSMMFGESRRRLPDEDTIHILKGLRGSYPNFFFDIAFEDADDFINSFKKLKKGDGSFSRLIDRYGVRRNDPDFWKVSDWFNDRFTQDQPLQAGIFDLNRYMNPGDEDLTDFEENYIASSISALENLIYTDILHYSENIISSEVKEFKREVPFKIGKIKKDIFKKYQAFKAKIPFAFKELTSR